MPDAERELERLAAENEDLKSRLAEAEDAIRAIRSGEVDAVVVSGPRGEQLFTLSGAERAYRLLVEAMNEGALVLDPSGSITYCNRTFALLLGVPLSSLIGSQILNYVAPEDEDAIRKLLETGRRRSGKADAALLKRRGAARVPVHISLARMDMDEPVLFSAVVTDLTDQKRAEDLLSQYRDHLEDLVAQRTQELAAANQRTSSILESIDDGFIAFDNEWRFTYINRNAEEIVSELTGLTRERLIGQVLWDALPALKSRPSWMQYQKAVAERTPVRFEEYIEYSGAWYHFNVYPSDDGLAVYFEDVTAQKQALEVREELYRRERHIAETLQGTLVPRELPARLHGCSVAVKYHSAMNEADIGGDFFDVFDLDRGRMCLVIGDVTGKGLKAALRVAEARFTMRCYAYEDPHPAAVLKRTNDALCKSGSDENAILTAFLAVVDAGAGTLTYASAGHEPPVIVRPDGAWSELNGMALPLGVMAGAEYREQVQTLCGGDRLMMVTDGITEARSGGVLFDKSGVVRYLIENRSLPLPDLVSGLLDAAIAHAGGTLQDDAALLAFEYRPPAG